MLSLSTSFLIPLLCLALKPSPGATLGHSGIAPLLPHLFHMLPHDLQGVASAVVGWLDDFRSCGPHTMNSEEGVIR